MRKGPVQDAPRDRKAERESAQAQAEHDWRVTQNLVAAIVILLLLAAGFWVAESLARAKRIDDCLSAGRVSCPRAGVSPRV